MAVMTWVNGRAIAQHSFTYARDGKKWRAVRSRSTLFDASGKASLVTDNDLSGVGPQNASSDVGALPLLKQGVRALANRLGRLASPDVLYAATTDDGSGCLMAGILLTAAGLDEVAAAAAVAGAFLTCATPAAPACIPAMIGAQAWLAAADIALGIAIANYYTCTHPTPITRTVTADGGGGGPSSCITIDWEISYDDGATWSYYYSDTVC